MKKKKKRFQILTNSIHTVSAKLTDTLQSQKTLHVAQIIDWNCKNFFAINNVSYNLISLLLSFIEQMIT